MSSKRVGWFADQIQRWQALYTAWQYVRPFLFPALTGVTTTFLTTLSHLQPWQIWLGGLYGFVGGLGVLGGIRFAFGKTLTGPPVALDTQRVRRLEYHMAHMVWIRRSATDPTSGKPQLDDVRRIVQKHRDQLIDAAPELFPLSVVDRFRVPSAINISRQNAEVAGMQHAADRAAVLGNLDSLIEAILAQWKAYSGFKAVMP